jgi:ribosome biogenesis protein MAK21
MFASRLLEQVEMPVKPDLASHTLIHFLDRFVYRNAKAATGGLRGSSIMQPLAGGDSKGVLVSNRVAIHGHKPLNAEAFWRKKAEDVAVDEVFFHKYFNQIGRSKQSLKKTKAEKKSEDAHNEDEEDGEDEIWQALVESRPEVEGESEDYSDMEMLDLDDSDQSSLNGSGSDLGDRFEDDEDSNASGVDFEDDDELVNSGSEADPGDEIAASDIDELFNQELEMAREDNAEKDSKPDRESSRSKRRKLKGLPTFASVEDYAEMMQDDDEEA